MSSLRLAAVTLLLLVTGLGVWAVLPLSGDDEAARVAGACRDRRVAPAYREQVAQVRHLVPLMRRAFAAPGLAVAVAADGRIVWSYTCGFADRGRGLEVTETTEFRIGSVSKTLTAAAAARLSQMGRLELDAEVQRYMPSFPRRRWPITARQLGGHLAGIRHYGAGEAVNTAHYDSVLASTSIFRDDPLVARPGERFSYSSYGFNLLGAVVAGAGGRAFREVVEETVLEPLGLAHTRPDDGHASRTRFYEVTERRTARPAPRVDLSDRYPAGGYLSTAGDLARLGSGVTDARFFAPRTQALLFTSQRTRTGEETGYGFGFEVGKSPYGPVAGHTGNVVGGTAFLFVHPRTRVVVAMTTNVGFVTVRNPPALGRDVPDPPRLALPFIRAVLGAPG